MKTYARVWLGEVVEIIPPVSYPEDSADGGTPSWEAGDDIPLERRYTDEFCAYCFDVTDLVPQPRERWLYDGSVFSAPQPQQLTPAEILASNTSIRDALLSTATLAIAPLQDAVDLDDATAADVALLIKWRQYRVDVNRIDLTQNSLAWPDQPV